MIENKLSYQYIAILIHIKLAELEEIERLSRLKDHVISQRSQSNIFPHSTPTMLHPILW